MRKYSHDYTKVCEAESMLYRATRLIANGCYDAAVERINEARLLLQEYLAQDNMVEDDDVADGWVKASEVLELAKGKKDDYDPWDNEWLRKKLEVIRLYVEGLSLSDIASKTGAARQTVKDIIIAFRKD